MRRRLRRGYARADFEAGARRAAEGVKRFVDAHPAATTGGIVGAAAGVAGVVPGALLGAAAGAVVDDMVKK